MLPVQEAAEANDRASLVELGLYSRLEVQGQLWRHWLADEIEEHKAQSKSITEPKSQKTHVAAHDHRLDPSSKKNTPKMADNNNIHGGNVC